jgi:hypothetical protein
MRCSAIGGGAGTASALDTSIQADQIPYFSHAAMDALKHDPQTLSKRLAERQRIERPAAAHQEDCEVSLRRLFLNRLASFATVWTRKRMSPTSSIAIRVA